MSRQTPQFAVKPANKDSPPEREVSAATYGAAADALAELRGLMDQVKNALNVKAEDR
ncbi:hypothetical protein [Pseudonocardia sp. D17]|jgi:hypothetical protein|uniref:hypothetical protein n=1 Tax=Pseudonocardia sp. D17 TaxID=882661 RepID=UPI002B3F18BA|nr:hypothetical protein PSD17_02940 [Pseudonocardia sp. D17]